MQPDRLMISTNIASLRECRTDMLGCGYYYYITSLTGLQPIPATPDMHSHPLMVQPGRA
jgi:hypothetical protein